MKITWMKILIASAVVAALAIAYVVISSKGTPVETGAVTKGPLSVVVSGEGKARVRTRHTIGAPVSGHLNRITLKAGAKVRQGETVAVISAAMPILLDARSRAEAQARLSAAMAVEAEAHSSVERARLAMDLESKDLERSKKLSKTGAISPQMLDGDEFQAKTAQKALEAAEFAAMSAKRSVDAARAVLRDYETGTSRDDRTVRVPAPVDGTILRVLNEQEGPIMAGTPLLEIGDPTDIEAVTDLLTTDAARVRPGMTVSIVRWGGKAALSGRVLYIEPSAFTKLSALGVEEQRVNVITVPASADGSWSGLSDGYRVETRIEVWSGSDVVRIPVAALFRRSTGWYAFLVEDGKATERKVEIGEKGESDAELLSGLPPGSSVVLYPNDKIKTGVKIYRMNN